MAAMVLAAFIILGAAAAATGATAKATCVAGGAGEDGDRCQGVEGTSLLQVRGLAVETGKPALVARALASSQANGGIAGGAAVEEADPCTGMEVRDKVGGHTAGLQRREGPARVVDFIQFFTQHELPELHLRLAEMGDFVDEIHIAEGDRDFEGNSKAFRFPDVLRSDAVVAAYRNKIVYHPMHVPPTATGYKIQEAVIAAQANISGAGVLLEGDLDEIVSRRVLRALRWCVPRDTGKWSTSVQMELYYSNMGWTAGEWAAPTIVRTFPEDGAQGGASLVASAAHLQRSKYIKTRPSLIVMTDGRPAGWHVAWTLDGAKGIANKLINGHIEGTPGWAKPYMHDQGSLIRFLEQQFLPHPDRYHRGLRRSRLSERDLPEAIRENREAFRFLLGDASA